MTVLLSSLAAFASLLLAGLLIRQYLSRRRHFQAVWAISMVFFAVGVACQAVGDLFGWSAFTYRLWYLNGAILTAAYMGMGSVLLQARPKIAYPVLALLVAGSLFSAWKVFTVPVDLAAALSGPMISGEGMPSSVRLLTPFFNIFGTFALAGGAFRSFGQSLWNGGSPVRGAGMALLAVGSLVVAFGGTLARFSRPEALPLSEFLGMLMIFGGFQLSGRRIPFSTPDDPSLLRRRKMITSFGIGMGVMILFGSVMILPVLPWTMGIITDAKHVYIDTLPEENRGAYLLTDQGVMQLYTWRVEPSTFPEDAPTLMTGTIREIAVVQKQFDPPENYRLYNLTDNHQVDLSEVSRQDMQLIFAPGSLDPGEYMLVVPTDSMYGGSTWHYFRIQADPQVLTLP